MCMERRLESLRASILQDHRWNRNPRPQPNKFSKLVLLTYFSQSYTFLNWLSGALVGVGGSDFIGQKRFSELHK